MLVSNRPIMRRGSRRHGVEVVALAMMAALPVAQPATASGDSVLVIDVVERDCTQIPPDEVPPPALSTDDALELDVRVLFERGDKAIVKNHMGTTEFAFERIGSKSWRRMTAWRYRSRGRGEGDFLPMPEALSISS